MILIRFFLIIVASLVSVAGDFLSSYQFTCVCGGFDSNGDPIADPECSKYNSAIGCVNFDSTLKFCCNQPNECYDLLVDLHSGFPGGRCINEGDQFDCSLEGQLTYVSSPLTCFDESSNVCTFHLYDKNQINPLILSENSLNRCLRAGDPPCVTGECFQGGTCFKYTTKEQDMYLTKQVFGIKADLQCVSTNINEVISFCNTSFNHVCLTPEMYCFNYLNDPSIYVAKDSANKCVKAGVVSSNPIVSCFKDSKELCVSETEQICYDVTDTIAQSKGIIGVTQASPSKDYYLCAKIGDAGSINCSEKTCMENTKCQYIDENIISRIGKNSTGACISYNPNVNQNASYCAKGYCVLIQGFNRFCEKLGYQNTKCKMNVGHACLATNEVQPASTPTSTVGYLNKMAETLDSFCLLLDSNQKQTCKKTKLSEVKNQATTIDYTCSSFADTQTKFNGRFCALGQYCLNSYKQCKKIDDMETSLRYSARLQDSTCAPSGTTASVKCSSSTCLLSYGVCTPLTPLLYIAQEAKTSACLIEGEATTNGVFGCYKAYCLLKNSSTNVYECKLMENDQYYSRDEQGLCMSKADENDPSRTIKYCILNTHCISNGKCKLLNPDGSECINYNGQCAPQGSCSECPIDSCLSSGFCVKILDNQCLGFDNLCYPTSNGVATVPCKACPRVRCYDMKSRTCKLYEKVTVASNECLEWVGNNKECQVNNMDIIEGFCAKTNSQCTNTESKECFRCGKSYLNIGDFVCYSALDRINRWKGTSIDGLQLTYVPLGNIYKTSIPCPLGCSECSSNTVCTRCLYGYFLISSRLCAPCDTIPINSYTSYNEYVYVTDNASSSKGVEYNLAGMYSNVQATCTDCTTSWNNPNPSYNSICLNFKISYGNLVSRVAPLYKQFQKYKLSQVAVDEYKISPTSVTNTACKVTECFTCSDTSNYLCKICNPGFVLSMKYLCTKCPLNCSECFYGGYYENKSVNWNDLQEIWSSLQGKYLYSSQYSVLCSKCQDGYAITNSYQTCDKCGNNCTTCVYTNGYVSIVDRFNYLDTFDLDFRNHCTVCADKNQIDKTNKSCELIDEKCDNRQISDLASMKSFTLNWYFNSREFYSTDYRCFKCPEEVGMNYVADNKPGSISCQDEAQISGCAYEVQSFFVADNPRICIECQSNQVFRYELTIRTCLNKCSDYILGCLSCYSYKYPTHPDIIYQCTKCESKMMPTKLGCVDCPTGCKSCVEIGLKKDSKGDIRSFTNEIIYYHPQESYTDRLAYDKLNSIGVVCTDCLSGYVLSQATNLCVPNKCGKNCGWCKVIGADSICLACTDIMAQISGITPYLNGFYDIEVTQQDLINFNADKTNCHLCPLGCDGCDETNTLSDPLNIYQTNCYSCKDINTLSTKLKLTHQFVYDRTRKKCTLCKIGDIDCQYEKERLVYAQCAMKQVEIGDGTFNSPLNILRFNEIDWDAIIFGVSSYYDIKIFVNELSIKNITLTIQFIGDKCEVLEETLIKSQLLSVVPSVSQQTIIFISNDITEKFDLILSQNFRIEGFTHVRFEKLRLIQSGKTQISHSLIIKSSILLNLAFVNSDLRTLLSEIDSKTYQFSVIAYELRETFSLNTVAISDFFFTKAFFDIQRSSATCTSYKFTSDISHLTMNQITLSNANLLKVLALRHVHRLNSATFSKNTISDKSVLFNFQQLTAQSSIEITWNSVQFEQNTVNDYGTLLIHNNANLADMDSISFSSNTFKNVPNDALWEKYALIQLNRINWSNVSLSKNKIENMVVFSNLIGTYTSLNTTYSVVTEFIVNTIIISGNNINQIGPVMMKIDSESNQNLMISIEKISAFEQAIPPNGNVEGMYFFVITQMRKLVMRNVEVRNSNHPGVLNTNYVQLVLVENLNIYNEANTSTSPILQFMFFVQNTKEIVHVQKVVISSMKNISASIFKISNSIESATTPTIPSIIAEDISISQTISTIVLVSQEFSPFHIFSVRSDKIIVRNSNVSSSSVFLDAHLVYFGTQSSSGIGVFGLNSNIELSDCSFSDVKSATTRNGLSIEGLNVKVIKSQFSNPIGHHVSSDFTEISGGLLYVQSEVVTIDSCSFVSGFAQRGGCIFFQGVGETSITVKDSFFKFCSCSTASSTSLGGAIYLSTYQNQSLDFFVIRSILEANYARLNGGGIYVGAQRTNTFISITYSIFKNNQAGVTGGIIDGRLPESIQAHILFEDNIFTHDSSEVTNQQTELTELLLESETNKLTSALIDLKSFKNIIMERNAFSLSQESLSKSAMLLCTGLIRIQNSLQVSDSYNLFKTSKVCAPFIQIKSESLTMMHSTISDVEITQNANDSESLIPQLIDLQGELTIQIYMYEFFRIKCAKCSLSTISVSAMTLNLISSQFIGNISPQGGAFSYHFNNTSTDLDFVEVGPFRLLSDSVSSSDETSFENDESEVIESSKVTPFSVDKLSSGDEGEHESRFLKSDSTMIYRTIEIRDSIFKENQSINNGGAILLHPHGHLKVKINTTKFISNQALEKGGALYLAQQSDDQQGQSQITISESIFQQNTAKIGGVYFSLFNPIIFQDPKSEMKLNVASEFGSSIVFMPASIKFIVGSNEYQQGSAILLIASGNPKEKMVGMFLTEQKEQFKELESGSVWLELTGVGNNQKIEKGSKIDWVNGEFEFNNSIVLYGQLKSQFTIKIRLGFSDSLYKSAFDSINTVLDKMEFVFQFLDECLPGYYLIKYSGKYDVCYECQESRYSLLANQADCSQCLSKYGECEKDKLILKDGYWRSNQQSKLIVECDKGPQYCLGDMHELDLERQNAKTHNSTQNYYCFLGHIGARCEDCDLRAVHWKDSFMKTSSGGCSNCTSQIEWNLIKLILLQSFGLVWALFQVSQSIKQMKRALLIPLVKQFGFKLKGSAGQKTSNDSAVYLKFFTNYLQLVSIITSVKIGISANLTTFIKGSANPQETSMNTSDCVLNSIYGILSLPYDIIFFRVLASQAIFLSLLLLIIFIVGLFCLITKRRNMAVKYILNCTVMFFLLNQPGMVNLSIGTISCENIAEKSYVVNYTAIECDDIHQTYSRQIVYPVLIFWAFAFPIILMAILRAKKKTLLQINTMLGFGFLYQEYKPQAYMWEMVKIMQKMCMLVVSNILVSSPVQNLCCQILIMFLYKSISHFCKQPEQPYRTKRFNTLDLIGTNVNCMSIAIMIMLVESKTSWVSYVAGIAFLLMNGWYSFLLVSGISQSVFNELKEGIMEKVHIYGNKNVIIMKLIKFLKIVSKERVLFLWASIRESLQLKKIMFKAPKEDLYWKKLKKRYSAAEYLEEEEENMIVRRQIHAVSQQELQKIQKKFESIVVGKKNSS